MDYDELNELIDELEASASAVSSERGPRLREYWQQIKQIGGNFKGTRYPTRAEKDEAWERFQGIVARIKARQDEVREEFAKRAENSAELRDEIIRSAEKARPTGTESTVEFVSEAITFGLFTTTERDLLKLLAEAMKEAWERFKECKEDLLRNDRDQAWAALKSVQEDLDSAWASLKEREQEARETRRVKKEAKHEEWQTRLRERIEKNEQRVEHLEEVLEHKKGRLEELEEQRDDARNDSRRARVQEWIDQEEEKIQGIEDTLEALRTSLTTDREKLD